jgi:hypothetical protein
MIDQQKAICEKYDSVFLESPLHLKVGISQNVKDGILPISGLRINPEGDTSGWYIWAGEELSQDDDFFVPHHIEHIENWIPNISKYLGLAPGWRFLIANDLEDVWFDEIILETKQVNS